MANVNVREQFQAHLGKTHFPINQNVDFSSAPSMILPVYFCHLNAGEKFHGNVHMTSRTEDVDTKAFTKIHEFVDWFFVPYQQLFREFGSWITGVDDIQSSLVNDHDPIMESVHHPLYVIDSYYPFKCFFEDPEGSADHWEAVRYALTQNDFQRLSDVSPSLLDKFGYPVIFGTARLYELLGHRLKTAPVTLFSSDNSHLIISNQSRVFESNFGAGKENLFLWAAYQKIWYDYFRDSDYDVNDRFAYNLDDLNIGAYTRFIFPESRYHGGLFHLRYRRWNTMYQNNFLPSPLQSIVGMLGQNADDPEFSKVLTHVNQWLTDIDPSLNDRDWSLVGNGGSPTNVVDENGYSYNPVGIDTLYAIRKISEVTRRAGKHYDDQILAHFGFRIPRDVNGEVYHIGQAHNLIQLQQVVSSADTESAGLGQIGGKGIGVGQGKDVRFTAPVSGIIMAVTSSMPEAIMPYGIDKSVRKAYREDFYQPEFDRLGMQPLFQSEIFDDGLNDRVSEVMAWQYRYLEDKSKYNISAGSLGLGGSRNYWTLNLENKDLETPMSPYNIQGLRYVPPTCLDPIMKIAYRPRMESVQTAAEDSTYFGFHKIFNTDPLIHHFEFQCSKESYMSAYGLPKL